MNHQMPDQQENELHLLVGERAKAIVENNKGAISGLMRRLDDIFPEKQI